MKKGLKITGIVLAVVLVLMIALPFAFQGKIKEIVLKEGNKMLNAEFGFDDLNISLFREFPKASIGLKNFWLKGEEAFENDTLVQAQDAQVAVNIMSLFGDSGFEVSKVLLANTYVKAIVLEDGHANWDVMKENDDDEEEEKEEDNDDDTFRILLKKVDVENLNIIYDDRQNNMYADIRDLNATCSGDMAADRTTLKLQTGINALTFKMDGIPFLSKVSINANMNIDADLKNNKFTLQDNTLELNAIKAGIDGWVALAEDESMSMDLKLNTSDVNFKEILSLIPAIYAKDFETLKANGTVSLNAFAKGTMQGDSIMPQFEMNMKVKDGSFRYPALPAGVDNIQVNAEVKSPGGALDLTEVNVSTFSFNMMGNAFGITANVKTPVSDPDFSMGANGTLDLGQIKNVYPLEEEMTLNGIVKANMNFAGRLSYIEKELYDKLAAGGNITLKDMILTMKDMPEVAIKQSTFTFAPQYLNLSETTVNIGKNDITADCRFENYMAFALKGQTLKGQLNVQSNHFNMNDFMTAEGDTVMAAAQEAETTEAIGVLIVPKNIDFNMNANMKEILFDKMVLNNLNGKLIIKDGKVDMKNLSMNTMGGSVVMNGVYSTANSETNPDLNASFAMNNLSFSQTFKELDMIQQMAPVFEKLKGNYSGRMSIDTQLDSVMSPVLMSMQGSGNISTKDLNISGVEVFDKIADATNYPDLKDINVKDMNIDFTIKNGRLSTQPFDIKVGAMNLNLSGSTGLDQTIDYTGKLKLPESAGAVASLTTIDLKIGGTVDSPTVSVDAKSMATQAATAVAEKAVDEIAKKLGIDRADAEKQKASLVEAAQKTGDKLVEEAEKQRTSLIEKAGSNTIKKIAAQKAGDALVNEAKEQAKKLVNEAEKQGDALIEKAETEE